MKSRSKTLVTEKSFRLIREGEDKYLVGLPIGNNRKKIRTLCYTKDEDEALQRFLAFVLRIDSSASLERKIQHLETIKCKNKYSNPFRKSGNDIDFKKGRLGSKLRQFIDKELKEPHSASHKTTLKVVVRSLNAVVTNETTITKDLVERYFSQYMNCDNHASPATINSYKKVISKLCEFIGVDVKKVTKGIKFYNDKQLKKLGVDFSSKNRVHLERSQIEKLVPELLGIKCLETKVALFIQLISGCRPSDGFRYELTANHIVIYANKTDSVIQISRTKVINAILFLLDIPEHLRRDINTDLKKYNETFKRCVIKSLGKKYSHIDRYCLRHTVLTQRVLNESPKVVAMHAGHASLRMLDENYVKNRVVREDGPIEDYKPINIEDLEDTYHGLLLEYIMFSVFPEFAKGDIPKCGTFKELQHIFSEENVGRKTKKALW